MEWSVTSMKRKSRVMEELIQGREMMSQLKGILRSDDVISAEGLVTKIMGSLNNTLVMLNWREEELKKEEEIVQANSDYRGVVTPPRSAGSAIAVGDSSSSDVVHVDDAVQSDDRKEDSCLVATRKLKDERGFYKKRKTLHSWTKDTLDLVDDGHAWRKYGQKLIHKSKHPRNYFRCTHKFEQGCNATKHDQKMQDDPQLYRTTYYANHTCIDHLRAQEFILDCSSREDSSQKNIIRFDNIDLSTCKQEHPFFKAFTSIKEEEMVKPISDHDDSSHRNQSTSSSSASLMSHEQSVFEPYNGFLGTFAYDQVDLISSMMEEYLHNEANFRYEF